MTDKTDIQLLEERLNALITERNNIVNPARDAIDDANAWFDKEAIPIRREIAKLLRAVKAPVKPKRKREKWIPFVGMDDWTDEDIAHYRELAARR